MSTVFSFVLRCRSARSFEWDHRSGMRDILSTQMSCGGYAALRDRILNSSKNVGSPVSLFSPSFLDQYKAAKAASWAS
jgi:hypothetical protein